MRVTIDVPVPRSANKNKKKKKGVATSGGPAEPARAVVDLEAPQAEGPQPQTEARGSAAVQASNPSSSNAALVAGKKRPGEASSTPNANLKKQKEIIQERLAEKGKLPSTSDFEACKRVGMHGLDLFNELAELMAGQMSKRLEGKISELSVHNRYLEGKLLRVQSELYAYRDENMVSFCEDNRALKEELELLRPVKEKLDLANNKVAEQKKQVKRLPVAEKELQEARKRLEESKAREKELNEKVVELTKA